MSVQEYLDKHMLSRKIEDAVNAAVRAKTPDPVLFISNHMKKSVPSVITKVKARQILDSRGIPTVEVDLCTNKGVFRASAPSGSASGIYGAQIKQVSEIRTRIRNKLTNAVNLNMINCSVALLSMYSTHLNAFDWQNMKIIKYGDKGTYLGNENFFSRKSNVFLILIKNHLQVSLYKHIADLAGKTNFNLPVPAFTLISGGKHAGNNLAIQDIMILPVGARKFEEALQIGSETYHHLKAVITEKYGSHGCNVGEDGEGLDFVKEAIDRAGYNEKIKIAIGVAATDFCIGTKYDLDYKSPNKSGQNFKSGDDMIDMYKELCEAYPIVSIEDPFDKEDWEHSKYFSSLKICQVVGDDLLMSNPKRIERAVQEAACNSLLIKINQVGTLTEAIEAVKLAKDAKWGVVVSQRSGESEDSFLADLAVGLTAGQIKAGAPCRGERLAKYNQLLRIEEELGDQAIYAGDDWRHC
ncbi:hypothetical protein BUALT_Bualt02G0056600 [Buddleja alternifolia]|uniref:phosphopyruvate hydratase n=1 Tax=Buddleja alternifolia TaxID=168488 RepID=A0AAV6XZW7_9LAMI|nr:hypothetical protein BUALT_Bualt02G0056600 [Buddleja alternifolia]